MTIGLTNSADPPERAELRHAVRKLCEQFGEKYWQQRDLNREYPEEFVDTLTMAGYLSALIPSVYGGLGLGITEAAVILEEINRSGARPTRMTSTINTAPMSPALISATPRYLSIRVPCTFQLLT